MLKRLREYINKSLWLIPTLMGALTTLFATGLLYLEVNNQDLFGPQWLNELNSQTITVTLSTMLGAIITVFGILLPVTFSILVRASNQFTSTILNAYRAAYAPKLFLGIIFATTIYLMAMLIALNYLFFPFIPKFSVVLSFIFMILTLASIPLFFDYFATSLEPSYVVASVATNLKKIVKKTTEDSSDEDLKIHQDREMLSQKNYDYAIACPKSGYLQSINTSALLKFCQKEDLFAAIPFRPGDFILKGTPVAYFNKNKEPNSEIIKEFSDFFSLGDKRIGIDDIEMQLDMLISVILRALSSSIADQATTIECINNIGTTTNLIINRNFSDGVHQDEEGLKRLYTKEMDYYDFVHNAFDRIRRNCNFQFATVYQLLIIIKQLTYNCLNKERAKILEGIAVKIVKEMEEKHLKSDDISLHSLLDLITAATK